MASFKKIRNVLVECLDDDVIVEEEFVLLYDLNRSKNPDLLQDNYERFDLESMDPAECMAEFCFEKADLESLAEAFGIPEVFKCDQRSVCDGMDGLCILLRRFAYPCRYSDMIARFGRPVPVISVITNKVMRFIYETHHHRLTNWNQTLLSPMSLQQYADAVSRNGAARDNCFGFVDGTVRPICCPGQFQRLLYNGHKKVHALKFQSLTLPNGMIGHMFGPVGR